MLIHPKLVGGTGNADILVVLGNNIFYLIEDVVGKLFGVVGRLGEVGHHNSGILMTFCHLVQIDQYLGIATTEIYILWEEHRGVAVCI